MRFRRCAMDGDTAVQDAPPVEVNGPPQQPSAAGASAVAAALGCADPNALVEIRPGDTVLDIGAGSCGDIGVLISEAGRTGSNGLVYGLSTGNGAERARIEAEAPNVRFVDGEIDSVPLPDESVDVVVSNCLVCLSADKPQVVLEASRLLAPDGRLGLADVVRFGEIPESVRNAAGVIGRALDAEDYKLRLRSAGFEDAELEVVHPFTRADLSLIGPMIGNGLEECPEDDVKAAEGKIAGVFVRARKTVRVADCC